MIVKISFVQDASRLEKYLKEKEGPGNPLTTFNTTLDGMTENFRRSQRACPQKGNEAIHIIQSWSPTESAKLTTDDLHRMGKELVTRFAPGHSFALQTHTDEKHAHNHIVLNPIHPETSKRIKNKKVHLHTLRGINDSIARENGLSVLPRPDREKRDRLTEKVKRIDRSRGHSYIMDLAQKARFASTHATSFDEFSVILSAFGIQTRVEEKNVTFFYPGRSQGKRGKALDSRLSKESLTTTFAQNARSVAGDEPARKALSEWVNTYETARATPERPKRGAGHTSEVKALDPGERLANIPPSEVARAKTHNIIDYCKKTGIELVPRDDDGLALKGRDYVHVNAFSWINTRNHTSGTIIDFVAVHKGVSYLDAVAAINQNPRLLALKSTIPQSIKTFQPFYIPKGESASRAESLGTLERFIGHRKGHPVYAELFKRQQAWVGRDGSVALLSERNLPGAIVYRINPRDEWDGSPQGESAPFLTRKGKSDTLVLFGSPREFLRKQPDLFTGARESKDSVLVLTSPEAEPVLRLAAELPRVRKVVIADPGLLDAGQIERLRESLNPFDIDVSLSWAAPRDLISQERGREREISFHST